MKITNIINKYHKFIKHSFVGGFDSLINLGIYFTLVYFGLHYLITNIISYSIASYVSFYLHLHWVFKPKYKKPFFMFKKYVFAVLFGLLFSELLIYLCVDILSINKYISAIIILPIITIESYLVYYHWVFKSKK